jgi:hypothetical protein
VNRACLVACRLDLLSSSSLKTTVGRITNVNFDFNLAVASYSTTDRYNLGPAPELKMGNLEAFSSERNRSKGLGGNAL